MQFRDKCAWLILLTLLTLLALNSHADSSVSASTKSTPRPRIGLVLSGGGGRGLAHIGVLKVLEKMRVPVDCISGTSMGGLVGGVYASGAPIEEIEQKVRDIDWESAFRDRPDRQNLRIRQKTTEEVGYLARPEFGVQGLEIKVPAGILYGQKIEKLFADLAFRANGVNYFADLPIPFKAVSTDIATGQEYILDRGELWLAMRATMSLPGVMAPVNINGKSLIDGGLVNNLPVAVAREMCADKVIAVNLGSTLLNRYQINSMFDVSEQMLQILTEQNVQSQLALLKDHDILISPDLGDIRTSSFDRVDETIVSGEIAAWKAKIKLQALSLSEEEYAKWQAQRVSVDVPVNLPVDEVRVAAMRYVNQAYIQAMLPPENEIKSQQEVDVAVRAIYDRGDFQRVSVRYEKEKDKRIAVIEAEEKSWGPNFLRFGVNLNSDLTGNTHYNLLAQYNQTWLNNYAGEWRNQLQLGYTAAFVSEFYQPLGLNSPFYLAPRVSFLRSNHSLFKGKDEVSQFTSRSARIGVDAGYEFGNTGELRIGAMRGYQETEGLVGIPVENTHHQIGGGDVRLVYDALDTLDFPKSGSAGSAELYMSRHYMGASQHYDRAEVNWLGAGTWRQNTLQLALHAGQALGDKPIPIYDAFTAGGFFMMGAYPQERFQSQEIKYIRLSAYRNIPPLLALNLGGLLEEFHIGAAWETAKISRSFDTATADGQYYSGSLFIGAKTLLGPTYLSLSRSGARDYAVWFTIGRNWSPR